MFVGWLECDVQLVDVHSLKAKRAIIRPILARLRRLTVSVAQVAEADVYQRARIGIAVTSGDNDTLRKVLDDCERAIADEPEITVLSIRSHIVATKDF